MSDSSQPCELQPAGLPCPWDFPGKNTGVGCRFLLQGIFPTQGSNSHLLRLPHQQADPLALRHLGIPNVLITVITWVILPPPPAKACFSLVHGFGESSRVVKKTASWLHREASSRSPDIRGSPRRKLGLEAPSPG